MEARAEPNLLVLSPDKEHKGLGEGGGRAEGGGGRGGGQLRGQERRPGEAGGMEGVKTLTISSQRNPPQVPPTGAEKKASEKR